MTSLARARAFLARGVALGTAAAATGVVLHAGTVAAPASVATTPVQATDTEPDAFEDVELAATAQFFLARDPFRPLRPETVSGGGGGGGVGDGGGGGSDPTDPGPADPIDTGGGGGGGGGTTNPDDDPCTDGSAEVVCDGDVVTLVAVDGDSAVVRVGGTVHTVGVGQVFADSYLLVSVDGSCASFLHGDDSFDLCVGEQVLK